MSQVFLRLGVKRPVKSKLRTFFTPKKVLELQEEDVK